MAEKMSTGLCNKLLDTDSFKGIFTGAFIDIYDGSVPPTVDEAPTGTLLCTVSNNSTGTGLTWGSAGAVNPGVIAKNNLEVWSGLILATSTATYYRLRTPTDSGANSTTDARVQGTIGTGGADMNLGTTALVSGATFTVSYSTQALVPN